MKKVLKVLGGVLLGLLLIIALAAIYNQFSPLHTYENGQKHSLSKPSSIANAPMVPN